MVDHRELIYNSYASTGQPGVFPADLSALRQRAPYLKRIIRRHFPPDTEANILELGCGHGAFIHFIRQAGYSNVIGVDVSREQVEKARQLGIDGVKQGDLMETLQQVPDASQDVVIAFDVIEHFTKDELIPLGREVHRALRGGGKWILHTPNGEALFGSRSYFWDFTHRTGFTRNSITQFLKAVGFSQVECYEDKVVVHGLRSAARWLIWESARLLLRVILAAETGNTGNDYILTQNFLTVAVK